MKLLFESWRRYVNEVTESFDEVDSLLAQAYPEQGWFVVEKAGSGKEGEVYIIQSEKTIEKRALKKTSPEAGDKEAENYLWVYENRKSLPEEARSYLPKVYDVKRAEDGSALIMMEVLEEAPPEIQDDLFMPKSDENVVDGDGNLTGRKDSIILSDWDSVEDIISSCLRLTEDLLEDEIASPRSLNIMRNKITKDWKEFYDSSISKTKQGELSRGRKISDNAELYPDWISDPRTKLTEIITHHMKTDLSMLLDAMISKYKRSVQKGMKSFYDRLVDNKIEKASDIVIDKLNKFPIPIAHHALAWDGKAHRLDMERDKSELFPEAAGLLEAINILGTYGFYARDIHSENVMMRSNTNQLVMVDLGQFQIKKKRSRTSK
jgi:hypothetical protein